LKETPKQKAVSLSQFPFYFFFGRMSDRTDQTESFTKKQLWDFISLFVTIDKLDFDYELKYRGWYLPTDVVMIGEEIHSSESRKS
jgi:hypothetical protein